jgi:hypothetical protein
MAIAQNQPCGQGSAGEAENMLEKAKEEPRAAFGR